METDRAGSCRCRLGLRRCGAWWWSRASVRPYVICTRVLRNSTYAIGTRLDASSPLILTPSRREDQMNKQALRPTGKFCVEARSSRRNPAAGVGCDAFVCGVSGYVPGLPGAGWLMRCAILEYMGIFMGTQTPIMAQNNSGPPKRPMDRYL